MGTKSAHTGREQARRQPMRVTSSEWEMRRAKLILEHVLPPNGVLQPASSCTMPIIRRSGYAQTRSPANCGTPTITPNV
jgi:hypothetical protein